jgi:rhodanese-related sulfurtransferase
MRNEYPTKEFLQSQKGYPIIDIRTAGEWLDTGILEGSHLVTFFDEMGNYDIDKFVEQLHEIIGEKKESPFLLICRTGSRTGQISHYLSKQGYNPVNLAGGIHYVMREKSYKIVPHI